jgi:hypothetical protein
LGTTDTPGEIQVVPQVQLPAKLVISVAGIVLGLILKLLGLLHSLRSLFMQNVQNEGEEALAAIMQ